MARYHPEDDLILEYSAGSLSEPESLLVATHLALCPDCRARVEQLEAVGGVLLENLEGEGVGGDLRDQVFARLDSALIEGARLEEVSPVESPDIRVPQPLRGYLDADLDKLDWKWRGPVDEVRILPEYPGVTSRLLRIKAGRAMPSHTHDGTELTLVLSGGFTDRGLHYGRGDIETANSSVDHAPVADEGEDCFCLAINDKRLRLTGAFTRFLNPFVRL